MATVANIILLITAILIVILSMIRSMVRDKYLDYEDEPCKGESCNIKHRKIKRYKIIEKVILWIEQGMTIICLGIMTYAFLDIYLGLK